MVEFNDRHRAVELDMEGSTLMSRETHAQSGDCPWVDSLHICQLVSVRCRDERGPVIQKIVELRCQCELLGSR